MASLKEIIGLSPRTNGAVIAPDIHPPVQSLEAPILPPYAIPNEKLMEKLSQKDQIRMEKLLGFFADHLTAFPPGLSLGMTVSGTPAHVANGLPGVTPWYLRIVFDSTAPPPKRQKVALSAISVTRQYAEENGEEYVIRDPHKLVKGKTNRPPSILERQPGDFWKGIGYNEQLSIVTFPQGYERNNGRVSPLPFLIVVADHTNSNLDERLEYYRIHRSPFIMLAMFQTPERPPVTLFDRITHLPFIGNNKNQNKGP